MNQKTQDLIAKLGLQAHPEGGHYSELYRSTETVVRNADKEERRSLTTIYFLLATGELSRWHVVSSDEVWHFYEGDDLELFIYDPVSKQINVTVLGQTTDGHSRVAVVPAGYWQAARPRLARPRPRLASPVALANKDTSELSGHSLVGCTVGPGFEFTDFQFVSDLENYQKHFVDALAEYNELL